MNRRVQLGMLCSIALGCLFGGATLAIESLSALSGNPWVGAVQRFLIALILPGIIGSAALSGNVHAFHLWVAALINCLIYFLLGVLTNRLILRAIKSRTSQRVSE